jgi:hypothetical protein
MDAPNNMATKRCFFTAYFFSFISFHNTCN